MAAVPITLVGISTDDQGNSKNVTFVGLASLTGLGVGGGPIIPPQGPNVPPHPEHPIWGPPGFNPPGGGGGFPPGIGGGPIIPPEPPIPPEVPNPSPPNTVLKPAPDEGGGWGLYTNADGTPHWAFRPSADQAGPKQRG